MEIRIAHLYPSLMNIYGDQGNVQTLIYRCQKRNIKTRVLKIKPGSLLKPGSFDLLFAGGGQDRQQLIIEKDLQNHKPVIKKAAQSHIPMLTICGTYQLFGQYFKPFEGPKLKGIGVFDSYTIAGEVRKIGNIVIKTNFLKPQALVGFENHSGNTYLGKNLEPLGKVVKGFGNNGKDKTEGAIFNNAYGCYLHGSLLPKNPHFADHLIKLALEGKHGKVNLTPLNDDLEYQAHNLAIKRTNNLRPALLK